jgi:hypothetical protein
MKRPEPCASPPPDGDPAFSPDDPDAREHLEKALVALKQVLSLLRELKRRAGEEDQGGRSTDDTPPVAGGSE